VYYTFKENLPSDLFQKGKQALSFS
jgi:hypothetical protein